MKQGVIIAGVGGQGVLVIGQTLAQAGVAQYENVSYFPSYSFLMRGGASECTVIFSDEKLTSPVLDEADAAIILDSSKVKAFEQMVKPGGVLVVEKAGLKEGVARDDIRVLEVSGEEVAQGIGDAQGANFVLLGGFVGATKAVATKAVEAELERRFGKTQRVLEVNRRAFREGVRLAVAARA